MAPTKLEMKKSSSVDGYLLHPVVWPEQGKSRKVAGSKGVTYDPGYKPGTCLCGSAKEFCPNVDFSFILPGGDIRVTFEKVNKERKAKDSVNFGRSVCVGGGGNAVQLAERGVGTTQPCQPMSTQTSKQAQPMLTQTTTQRSQEIQTRQPCGLPTWPFHNTRETKTFGKSAAKSVETASAIGQPFKSAFGPNTCRACDEYEVNWPLAKVMDTS